MACKLPGPRWHSMAGRDGEWESLGQGRPQATHGRMVLALMGGWLCHGGYLWRGRRESGGLIVHRLVLNS